MTDLADDRDMTTQTDEASRRDSPGEECSSLSQTDVRRLRLLVAIASYGEKNLKFLKQMISTYRRMPFDVDVVVLCESPKNLGNEAEVVVGLPSRNPWSLPFAHKAIFAQRA